MGNRKRKFGDRREGRLLRSLDPYNAMTPFIMKKRNDASNYFSDSIEITGIERFLRGKRLHGYPGMGLLHLFIAAFVRVSASYPGINRFVAGQRVYSRNTIEYVMTVKKEMRTDASETSIKVSFDPSDTINEIYDKLNKEIEGAKSTLSETNTDAVAKAFMKLPRIILKFVVFALEVLDYFNMMPKVILRASPFHGSIIITDIGSIGMPPIYHHLYNFGNIPIFIAMGAKRRVREIRQDGVVVERKYVDYNLVADERICDGFYFSQALKLFRNYLRKPQLLDVPPETVVEDVD